MPSFIGPWELIILGVILVAVFGAGRLPSLGRQAGKAARQATREVRDVKEALLVSEADDEGKGEPKSDPPPSSSKSALQRILD